MKKDIKLEMKAKLEFESHRTYKALDNVAKSEIFQNQFEKFFFDRDMQLEKKRAEDPIHSNEKELLKN